MIRMKKKVLKVHFVYWILICVIVNLFLLLIIPRQISDAAFTNFSFASTIVSIILAVITIVYSFISGASVSNQLCNISQVESRIGAEVCKLSLIDGNLQNAVGKLDDVFKTVQEISRKQDLWLEMYSTVEEKDTKNDKGKNRKNNLIIMDLFLYVCYKSKMSSKPIPEGILDGFLKGVYRFCNGALVCAMTYIPDKLNAELDKSAGTYTVTTYNENALKSLASIEESLANIESIGLRKRVNELKSTLDAYFGV